MVMTELNCPFTENCLFVLLTFWVSYLQEIGLPYTPVQFTYCVPLGVGNGVGAGAGPGAGVGWAQLSGVGVGVGVGTGVPAPNMICCTSMIFSFVLPTSGLTCGKLSKPC